MSRIVEKQPFPEMPATRKGVASTKQDNFCLGTPESQVKTKVLAKITSQRGPKVLRSKKIRLESDIWSLNWSYQTYVFLELQFRIESQGVQLSYPFIANLLQKLSSDFWHIL